MIWSDLTPQILVKIWVQIRVSKVKNRFLTLKCKISRMTCRKHLIRCALNSPMSGLSNARFKNIFGHFGSILSACEAEEGQLSSRNFSRSTTYQKSKIDFFEFQWKISKSSGRKHLILCALDSPMSELSNERFQNILGHFGSILWACEAGESQL